MVDSLLAGRRAGCGSVWRRRRRLRTILEAASVKK